MSLEREFQLQQEVRELRQQLAAALAACKVKDKAITTFLQVFQSLGNLHGIKVAREALAIQPDDATQKKLAAKEGMK